MTEILVFPLTGRLRILGVKLQYKSEKLPKNKASNSTNEIPLATLEKVPYVEFSLIAGDGSARVSSLRGSHPPSTSVPRPNLWTLHSSVLPIDWGGFIIRTPIMSSPCYWDPYQHQHA